MADTQVQVNQAFLDFLAKTPEALAYFYNLVKAFIDQQSAAVVMPPVAADGPTHFDYDTKPAITVKPLTNDELNALVSGYAEAIVKEKCLEYIKGFLTGVMLVAA